MKSLKSYSYAVNFITFICGLITFLGIDNLRTVIPENFQYLIPVVVLTAGYILVQLSENARVVRAEDIVRGELNDKISKQ